MDAYEQEKADKDMGERMERFTRLRGEAARSAGFVRGHNELKGWESLGAFRAVASCLECNAEVVVIERPQPNETEIAGEAIAVNCPAS